MQDQIPTTIQIKSASLRATDIQVGSLFGVQELSLEATSITLRSEPQRRVHIAELSGSVIITELNLNRAASMLKEEDVTEIEIVLLTGRMRIAGKVKRMGLWVPFSVIAIPEVEGGARVQFRLSEVKSGPLAAPKLVVARVETILNERLADHLDTTRLPYPVRLVAVQSEPGRLLLSASASLELIAPESTGSELAQI